MDFENAGPHCTLAAIGGSRSALSLIVISLTDPSRLQVLIPLFESKVSEKNTTRR